MHELRKDYGHITDGNYSVLHHFYDYVYSVIRCATLTFFWPLPYVYYYYYMYTLVYHVSTARDCQWLLGVWITCLDR